MIYIASRVRHAAKWVTLRNRGMPISSSWIYEAGDQETSNFQELWLRIDLEVRRCEKLVFYAEPEDFPLKGALVEVGMAIANRQQVIACLPDVVLRDRTMRPVGSWLAHPLVVRMDDYIEKFNRALRPS